MKPVPSTLGLTACVLLGAGTLWAAQIPEPATIFYGRIISRMGELDFPVTEGELTWVIAVPNQGDREYTLSARVQPFGNGQFSYRLVVPHQVLAFDLAVQDRHVPLTAAGWTMRHVRVQVNGQNAVLAAPSTDSFTAGQSARASAHRVDLVLPALSADSDGDGAPDWWEDKHGTDKWNPRDRPPAPGNSSSDDDDPANPAVTLRTFLEWRQHYFPGTHEDPASFARMDSNNDGIPHLLEYAFELDPHATESSASARLPRPLRLEGRPGITFQRRASATDLEYHVEASGDLVQWSDDSSLTEAAVIPGVEAASGQQSFVVRSGVEVADSVFLRIRVSLK